MTSTTGWGGASWGGSPWGGAVGPFAFATIFPHRENVLRIGFSTPPNATGLLDVADALSPSHYSVAAVGVGLDAEPARAVVVVDAVVAVEQVDPSRVGRLIDLVLDRAMSPDPSQYVLTYSGILSFDLSTSLSGTVSTYAVFRLIQPPTAEFATPTVDFASRQTAASGSSVLGLTPVGEDGDYAVDVGVLTLKKRVIRRLITRKGKFAHLPLYGVGVLDQIKRLAKPGVLATLAADAQIQIGSEPDVASVIVTAFVRDEIAWFRVRVQPKVGREQQFAIPFPIIN